MNYALSKTCIKKISDITKAILDGFNFKQLIYIISDEEIAKITSKKKTVKKTKPRRKETVKIAVSSNKYVNI